MNRADVALNNAVNRAIAEGSPIYTNVPVTLASILNGKQGDFIPRSIFRAYGTEAEMVAFIESCGDTVSRVAYNTGNGTCSILIYTVGGYQLARNGYLHVTR